VATTRGKQSKEAKKLMAATRRHMKRSRAIAMLGFALDSVAEGRAVLRLDARAHHKQLNDVVHGGILAAMADTASAIAAYTTVPAGVALATVELKINYLEGVAGGRIRAEARVLRTGRNFVVTECAIFGAKGTLAAKALLTFGAAGGHSIQR
jgi:acyl-CoA thioesterase